MPVTQWEVLPHGPLVAVAENLWLVTGDLPRMALKRNMTVARLQDGGLVLHSAIAMDAPHMDELEALGPPRWLVVPNGWHRLDAAKYKHRYPELKVVCPADARESVQKEVDVDATYSECDPLVDGDTTVRLLTLPTHKRMEGVMLVRSEAGVTAVFGDTLFNIPELPGLFGLIYGKWMGATGGPRITPIGRLMLRWDGNTAQVATELRRLADYEHVTRLIPGHGDVVEVETSKVLRTMAAQIE